MLVIVLRKHWHEPFYYIMHSFILIRSVERRQTRPRGCQLGQKRLTDKNLKSSKNWLTSIIFISPWHIARIRFTSDVSLRFCQLYRPIILDVMHNFLRTRSISYGLIRTHDFRYVVVLHTRYIFNMLSCCADSPVNWSEAIDYCNHWLT